MESRDIKIIIIGMIISFVVNQFIMFIHTVIEMFSTNEISIPLAQYFLDGYLPLVIAGVYIAITKSNKKILLSILVGFLYGLSDIIFNYFIFDLYDFSLPFEETSTFLLIRNINSIFLYPIFISGSCVIASYIKERYSKEK